MRINIGSRAHIAVPEPHLDDLHIDILPEYHRKGYGGQLINALFDHLRSKGVKVVMLTVGERNSTGIGFYKKYGYKFIEQWKDDVAFGMKL